MQSLNCLEDDVAEFLTLPDIQDRIDDYNNSFGDGTIWLLLDLLIDDQSWQEIRNHFASVWGEIEQYFRAFQGGVPSEYRQIKSFFEQLKKYIVDRNDTEGLFNFLQGQPYVKFLTGSEDFYENPINYYYRLMSFLSDKLGLNLGGSFGARRVVSGTGTGIKSSRVPTSAFGGKSALKDQGFWQGLSGFFGRGGANRRPGPGFTSLNWWKNYSTGAVFGRTFDRATYPSSPGGFGYGWGAGTFPIGIPSGKTPATFSFPLSGGSFASAMLSPQLYKAVAPYLNLILAKLKSGGPQAAYSFAEDLLAQGIIDQVTFDKMVEAIDTLGIGSPDLSPYGAAIPAAKQLTSIFGSFLSQGSLPSMGWDGAAMPTFSIVPGGGYGAMASGGYFLGGLKQLVAGQEKPRGGFSPALDLGAFLLAPFKNLLPSQRPSAPGSRGGRLTERLFQVPQMLPTRVSPAGPSLAAEQLGGGLFARLFGPSQPQVSAPQIVHRFEKGSVQIHTQKIDAKTLGDAFISFLAEQSRQ